MWTVSARARQLNHRLKNRKNAIISRREKDAPVAEGSAKGSGPRVADMGQSAYNTNGRRRSSVSPSSGFVAVNSRQIDQESYAQELSRTAINGASAHGASAATRAELLGKFFTTNERAVPVVEYEQSSRRASVATPRNSSAKSRNIKPATAEPIDFASILLNSASPVPIPSTPSSLLPYSKPVNERDESGPYKAEMVNRMELLLRGDRIVPPCDRCRRLHMDCLKNLTACIGCTRKHAKCSWKDVNDEELRDNPPMPRAERTSGDEEAGGSGSERETCQNLPNDINNEQPPRRYPHDERQGVADEELLGEDATDEDELALPSHKFEEGNHHNNKVYVPVTMKRPLSAASPTPKIEPDSEPPQQERDLGGAASSSSPAHGLAQIANGSMNHNDNHTAAASLPLPSEGEKMDRLGRLFDEELENTAHPSREGQTASSFGLAPPTVT